VDFLKYLITPKIKTMSKTKKEFKTEGIPGFDWVAYEADSPKLRQNKSLKRHPGDNSKVFCHLPYAQDLYEAYYGKSLDLKEPTEGSVVSGKVVSVGAEFAIIDVNWREDAMIDLSKENQEYLKYIKETYTTIDNYIQTITNKKIIMESFGTFF
jgi:hypothetical protein